MSIPITIAGTIVNFPSDGASPDWAPAIIQFAQLVASALSLSIGPFDVPPQVMNIDAYNPGTLIDIPPLSFPTSQVRCVFINYAVYRTTTTTTAYEAGVITAVFSANNSPTQKWEYNIQRVGDASINFFFTDLGQVQFTTGTLSGINHTGTISFSAKAELQS